MRQARTNGGPRAALRAIAMGLPEVEEGVACKGTSLESLAFQARKKTFLFVGPAQARLKVCESHSKASTLAAREPERYSVGSSGWVKVSFGPDDSLPLDLLEAWIEESYRLIAPKPLVALLPPRSGAAASTPAKRKPTKQARNQQRNGA